MSRILACLFLIISASNAPALGLEEYLAQVRAGNKSLSAARAMDSALKLVALEPDAMLSPYLSASLAHHDDRAEPVIPFSPERTTATQAEVSVNKQVGFSGTRLSLGYRHSNTALRMPPGLFGPGNEPFMQHANGVSVSVAQPLLKDFGARGYGIARRKADASTGSAALMNRYGAQAVLFEAEATYAGLAALLQVDALLSESLERNKKILEWTQSKYQDNLADKVDVLQVQAAQKQVEAGILATRAEAGRLREKFNLLRGLSPTAETGELSLPPAPAALPEGEGRRGDLAAAELALDGTEAMVDEVVERYIPDLTLFGTATGTGADRPNPGESWAFDHPTYVAGIRLTTILDFPLYRKVVKGAEEGLSQGREDLEARRQKAAQEWAALRGQWESLQAQLALARELEAVQKEKAEREKRRYQDGRTTNFQVLRFDEDFNQARIQTLRLESQASVLAAQARFYRGEEKPW